VTNDSNDRGTHPRYHRQVLLREVGESGQARLAASHAVIIGCGALGSVAAEMLTRAGVGTLTLIDRDVVEITNLQRQSLYDEDDARQGLPKAEAARRRLSSINSTVSIRAVVADVNWRTVEGLLGLGGASAAEGVPPVAVILDGTDNFETRYLINDVAVKHGIPWVYTAAVGTSAMMLPVIPEGERRTACLRCLFEEPPARGSAAASATCDTVGVLGPVPAAIANLQAVEAIKILLGRHDAVSRSLLSLDAWANELRRIDVSSARREECPCCGRREFDFLSGDRAQGTAVLCGRKSVQVFPDDAGGRAAPLDLDAISARLAPHGELTRSEFLIRTSLRGERGDSGAPLELTVFADGRAIIGGTERPDVARALYAKYVGA